MSEMQAVYKMGHLALGKRFSGKRLLQVTDVRNMNFGFILFVYETIVEADGALIHLNV